MLVEELIEKLKKLDPKLKVIATNGIEELVEVADVYEVLAFCRDDETFAIYEDKNPYNLKLEKVVVI